MKKLAALAILAALPALPALAQDAAPAPWTGYYVGLHAGFGFGTEFDTQSDFFVAIEDDQDNGGGGADEFPIRGPVAGFHLGFAVQNGAFVYGFEADLDWARLTGGMDYSYLDGGAREGTLSFTSSLQSSGRARLGVAVADNTLIYATGGFAFAQGTLTDDGYYQNNYLGPVSETQWFFGYTVGGGVEQAFGEGLMARLEVRHSRFGTRSFDHAYVEGLEIDDGDFDTFDVNFNQTTITGGISKFF